MSQPDIAFCDERKETTNNQILWQLGITDPLFLGDHGKYLSKGFFARKVEIPEQKENQLAFEKQRIVQHQN